MCLSDWTLQQSQCCLTVTMQFSCVYLVFTSILLPSPCLTARPSSLQQQLPCTQPQFANVATDGSSFETIRLGHRQTGIRRLLSSFFDGNSRIISVSVARCSPYFNPVEVTLLRRWRSHLTHCQGCLHDLTYVYPAATKGCAHLGVCLHLPRS